jgi:hypothetical protein
MFMIGASKIDVRRVPECFQRRIRGLPGPQDFLDRRAGKCSAGFHLINSSVFGRQEDFLSDKSIDCA